MARPLTAILFALAAASAHAQADVAPARDLPNAYTTSAWGTLPEGRTWGTLSAVAMKFSPDGNLLLTNGTPGIAGHPPQALTEPTSIVELPNGDVLISEGHSGQGVNLEPNSVARLSRFSADGKFLKSIGRYGTGP